MYPIFFSDTAFAIPAWHSMFVLGACLAFYFFYQSYISGSIVSDLKPPSYFPRLFFVCCYISTYFGARLFAILVEQQLYNPLAVLKELVTLGPVTSYGGGITAFVVGYTVCKINKVSPSRIADIAFPAAFLAIAVGRVGCFLNGDDYGIAVSDQMDPPFWAVSIPVLNDQVWRHPTQLYLSAWSFIIFLVTYKIQDVSRILKVYPSSVALICASLYALGRFNLEFLRGDNRGRLLGIEALSPAQIISIGVFVLSITLGYLLRAATESVEKPK